MDWFKRLPGFRRSPPGWEWLIWKKLPAILVVGTLLPALVVAALWWLHPADADAQAQRDFWRLVYIAIGVVLLHWTLVLTLAIACFIVRVMKGPAYVADAYPLIESEHPVKRPSDTRARSKP